MRLIRVRFTVRRMMVGVVIAALGLAYVGSYYQLSRRGIREAADYGIDGFLYGPAAEAVARQDYPPWHHALTLGYAPLNWLDRKLFGAPSPASGIMWRLSG
jgi:hypothetical protein